MMKKVPCPKCNGWGHISEVHENGVSGYQCKECLGTGQIEVPMTNADRINSMGIKEKAQFLTRVVADGCPPAHDWDCMKDDQGWDGCDACWEMWLQQPCGVADNA